MFIVIALLLLQHARAGGYCRTRHTFASPDLVNAASRLEGAAKSVGTDFKEAVEISTNNLHRCTGDLCLTAQLISCDLRETAEGGISAVNRMTDSIDAGTKRIDICFRDCTGQICDTLVLCTGQLQDVAMTGLHVINEFPQRIETACTNLLDQAFYKTAKILSCGVPAMLTLHVCGKKDCDFMTIMICSTGTVYVIERNVREKVNKCLMNNSLKQQKLQLKLLNDAYQECQQVLEKVPAHFENGILEMNDFVGLWARPINGEMETYTVQKRNDIGVVRNQLSGTEIGKITTQQDDEENKIFVLSNTARTLAFQIKKGEKDMVWKHKGNAVTIPMIWVKIRPLEDRA